MTAQDLVIVGGGLAAVRTAQAVRDLGHRGRIVLASEEAELPYDRPPLSKEMLLGGLPDEALRLWEADAYATHGIEVLLEHRAVALDPAARVVGIEGGDSLQYGQLVIATGSRARRLDAVADGPDVHYLRTANDARRLAAALLPGAAVAIVGAGFIGLEVASCAVALGCTVTVVEVADRPLSTALGPDVSAWLQRWHAGRGVRFRCGVTIQGEDAGRPQERLRLSDGTSLAADVIVIGVGVARELDWLCAAGLDVLGGGLVCDLDGRTSVAGVFGAGDVVRRVSADGAVLIGHWTLAGESAARAARAVLELEQLPAVDEAFFWSNQAGLRLQSVGRFEPGSVTTVVSGDLESGTFVAHHELDGRLIGVIAANSPRHFLASRMALRQHASDLITGVTA